MATCIVSNNTPNSLDCCIDTDSSCMKYMNKLENFDNMQIRVNEIPLSYFKNHWQLQHFETPSAVHEFVPGSVVLVSNQI